MDLYETLKKLKKSRFGKLVLRRGFLPVAAVVVFVTTYALILPALTASTTTYCGKDEHKHDDSCYTVEKILVCGKEESKGHTHTSSCYEVTKELICGLEESAGHTHSDACYDEEGNLICGLEESAGHTHTADCYEETTTLICGQEETKGHTHTSSCYKEKKTLTCQLEEHEHTEECYSDTEADTESASTWEKSMAGVKLTGDWSKDIIAIAESQLGYTESTKNYVTDDAGNKKGYTRYGDWYGIPYGDWCAMFVSFCLNYADIGTEYIPRDANCQSWINKLSSKDEGYELYRTINQVRNGEYELKAGDLIFFDWENDGTSDHIGIVYELKTDDDGNLTGFKTIEGNSSERVEVNSYDIDYKYIKGFGELPKNPDEDKDKDEDEKSEDADEASEEDTEDVTEEEEVSEKESDEAEESDEDAEEEKSQTVDGSDYQITLTWGKDAEIPEDATVQAEEYDKDSATYQQRYAEAAELYGWDDAVDYTNEFRLYNIGFFVENEEIEPAGEVGVNITYTDEAADAEADYQVTHYTEDEPETMDAVTTTEDGETVIDFTTDSFSDYSTSPGNGASTVTEDNLLAYFTFANGSLDDSLGHAKATVTEGTAKWGYQTVEANTDGRSFDFDGSTCITITDTDGNSLLNGYNEVSLDFWMKANATSVNGWPFFIASDSNEQVYLNEKYLGAFVDPAGTTLNAEKYYNNGSRDGASVASVTNNSLNSSLVHVRVDYTTNQTMLTVWDADGKQIASSVVTNTRDIASILGSDSVIQLGKANWKSGKYYEYYSGIIDNLKIYARKVDTSSKDIASTHPDCALPLTVDVNHQLFYSIDASNSDIAAVSGVKYTVYKSDGSEYKTYTTQSDFTIDMGSLPAGTYTIKQTYVPDGYILSPQTKTFTVVTDQYTNVGVFYVYKNGTEGVTGDKTAQVVDYINRTYQVDLSANSGLYKYNYKTRTYSLVVDQSNSMLFPAVLTKTSKSITLKVTTNSNGTYKSTGDNSKSVEDAGLDKSQVYYIIADESTTSTVYAIFYDSTNNGWCYQDAAYYAKAQFHERGIYTTLATEENGSINYVNYPTAGQDYDANGAKSGGGIDKINTVSKLGKDAGTGGKSFTVYTGSSYDRLHELQEAVSLFAEQLAAISPDSTLNLITFDRYVESCLKIDKIGATGAVTKVIKAVNNIATSGGTRQDRALYHVSGNDSGQSWSLVSDKGTNHTNADSVTILITDGAPVTSGDDDDATIDKVKTAAKTVSGTLITVGLSTTNVTGGSSMLQEIASSSGSLTSTGKWFFDVTDTVKLANVMANNILFKLGTKTYISCTADIKDVISDSFYPIDPSTNQPLASGTRIALDGTVNKNGPGTVTYDSSKNEWYVTWDEQSVSKTSTWNGRIYLKAKEDFIGGNTIDTNKSASVTVTDSSTGTEMSSISLPTPTVNVRLLPFKGYESEETVFLGDDVTNIKAKIQMLLNKTVFEKISPYYGTDNILNYKTGATEANGCASDTFTIPYAIAEHGTSTWSLDGDDDGDGISNWQELLNGDAIKVDYTYDDASSNGAVGYFTIQLKAAEAKNGETIPAGYKDHATSVTGTDVEKYTLSVTYTAYRIGEKDTESTVRGADVHNGTKGPGTEVGSVTTTLENGKGTENVDEIHHVHVIDGEIYLTKIIDNSLKSDKDQTYTFEIKVVKNGVVQNSVYKTVTVTVKAGDTQGTAVVSGLPRNTYRVSEVVPDKAAYMTEKVQVVVADTNCCYDTLSDSLDFKIGTNRASTNADNNVITYVTDAPVLQSSVYVSGQRYVYSYPFTTASAKKLSTLQNNQGDTEGSDDTFSSSSLSYGRAAIYNTTAKTETEISVEKIWSNGKSIITDSTKHPSSATVQLYQVTDGRETSATAYGSEITLDESNNWKTTVYELPLMSKDKSQQYTYYFKETNVSDDYLVCYSDSEPVTGGTVTITNVENKKPANITVTKKWMDGDKEIEKTEDLPDIEVTLYQVTNGDLSTKKAYGDETTTNPITLSYSNGWTYTAKNLPLRAVSGNTVSDYTYYFEEKLPDGYDVTYSNATTNDAGTVTYIPVDSGEVTITNTILHTTDTTEVTAKKVWKDSAGKEIDASGMSEIKLTLYKVTDGATENPVKVQDVTLNNDNSWTQTIENLPKKATYGTAVHEYTYYFEEQDVPVGYEVSYSNAETDDDGNITYTPKDSGTITVTNQAETGIRVSKVWQDYDGDEVYKADGSITYELHQVATTTGVSPSGTDTVTLTVKDTYNVSGGFTASYPKGTTVTYKLTNGNANYWWWVTPVTATANGVSVEVTESERYNYTSNNDGYKDYSVTLTLNEDTLLKFSYSGGNVWSAGVVSVTSPETSEITPSDGSKDSCYETNTLDASVNWTRIYKNLPLTKTNSDGSTTTYTYYVKEVSDTTNYEVTYINNDGITEGQIKIVNRSTEIPTYELPETGGPGTITYTLGGLVLMMSSLVIYLFGLRRRRERRFR